VSSFSERRSLAIRPHPRLEDTYEAPALRSNRQRESFDTTIMFLSAAAVGLPAAFKAAAAVNKAAGGKLE